MVDQLNFPNLKWAQRRDMVFITIDILDVEKTDINLSDDGKLVFRAESQNKKYGFDMELFNSVDKANSGWNLKGRNVLFRLTKKEDDREEYWPRITKDKTKNQKITIDWSKWVDEDEADEAPADDGMEGMQGFGGQGGMPGMPGMGGAGGMEGMDMAKLQQMMAGMQGGAGGMPGMPGMGGMGGPDSDDDDEEEQEAAGKPKTLADLDGEAE